MIKLLRECQSNIRFDWTLNHFLFSNIPLIETRGDLEYNSQFEIEKGHWVFHTVR